MQDEKEQNGTNRLTGSERVGGAVATATPHPSAKADVVIRSRTMPQSIITSSTPSNTPTTQLLTTPTIWQWPAPSDAPFRTAPAPQRPAPSPAILLPGRRARFRLPRSVKSGLVSGFCGEGTTSPRTMVIVAHQDDESIGAGARLAGLSDTWVVHVTDGAPPDPFVARRYGFPDRDAYAAARADEARRAMEVAGIPRERQIALGLMDGTAANMLVQLCVRLADLLDTIAPDVVVTHPYEGGHTDHDSTAFAVHLAIGLLRREGTKPPAVLELTSYNGYPGSKVLQQFIPHERADRGQRCIILPEEERLLKQRMFECFETQQALIQDFDPGRESFRPAPRYLFTRPPHRGRLNYERYGNPALGREWRERASAALRELKLRQH